MDLSAKRALAGLTFWALMALPCSKAWARAIFYGSETETVTVAYGGPTLLRFNEEVKTVSQASHFVITPVDKKRGSYSTLAITPRRKKGSNKVTFILADETVISTKIVIVPSDSPEHVDSFYDFNPKQSLASKEGPESQATEIDLMKAMIRGGKLNGYTRRYLIRAVKSQTSGLSAQLVQIYTGEKFNGYIFEIKNLSKRKTYHLDLKNLSLGHPNQAILSQIDRDTLPPKRGRPNSTLLRIVARPTSSYQNINLPVAPVGDPSNQKSTQKRIERRPQ